jgi:hypothetical protein
LLLESFTFFFLPISASGHAVAQLVEALRYKPERGGFTGIFHWHNPSGPGVD